MIYKMNKQSFIRHLFCWLTIFCLLCTHLQITYAASFRQEMSESELKTLMNNKNFEIISYTGVDFNNDLIQDYIVVTKRKSDTNTVAQTIYLLLVNGKTKHTIAAYEEKNVSSIDSLKTYVQNGFTHFTVNITRNSKSNVYGYVIKNSLIQYENSDIQVNFDGKKGSNIGTLYEVYNNYDLNNDGLNDQIAFYKNSNYSWNIIIYNGNSNNVLTSLFIPSSDCCSLCGCSDVTGDHIKDLLIENWEDGLGGKTVFIYANGTYIKAPFAKPNYKLTISKDYVYTWEHLETHEKFSKKLSTEDLQHISLPPDETVDLSNLAFRFDDGLRLYSGNGSIHALDWDHDGQDEILAGFYCGVVDPLTNDVKIVYKYDGTTFKSIGVKFQCNSTLPSYPKPAFASYAVDN